MGNPRNFIEIPRQSLARQAPQDRVQSWREFEIPLPAARQKEQAARCIDCGIPFCQTTSGCPVENRIPEWNELVGRGEWKRALEQLHATNNFPEFTGKLCPAPCETACVAGIHSDPVSIRQTESAIIEWGFSEGYVQPLVPETRTGKRIAVVGSGPAGLAAAQQLARSGHDVHVYEKSEAIGGLIRFGIPDFKFEKRWIDRRIHQMKQEGVVFHTSVNVGRDVSLADLRANHHAVLLAVGAEHPRPLEVPGNGLQGVHLAMDYLTAQNRAIRTGVNSVIHARGKRVIILGGGDTGSDCLGTALRQGCRSVEQFEIQAVPPTSRGADQPWPSFPFLLKKSHAHEEGGSRRFGVSTLEILGDPQTGVTRLRGVEVDRTSVGFVARTGTEFELEVDLLILAMGFTGAQFKSGDSGDAIVFTPQGRIAVGQDFQTNRAGVFAAGDATRGASLIVWAIRDGRKMAESVERYLKNVDPGDPNESG